MSRAAGLDLSALGEALGPLVRGAAELRPWLPPRAVSRQPVAVPASFDPGEAPYVGAALLEVRDGAHALELWRRIRALGPLSGALPVVVGSAEDVAAIEARFAGEDAAGAPDRLARSLAEARGEAGTAPAPQAPLGEAEARGMVDGALGAFEELRAVELAPEELAPRDEPFLFPDELDGAAFVALVPEDAPALVPVHLRFARNEGGPRELASTLRRWEARVGAIDVVFAGAATLELELARPPATARDVRALAFEHSVFCPAVVEQGSGSLEKLAREIAGSRRWAFWWD